MFESPTFHAAVIFGVIALVVAGAKSGKAKRFFSILPPLLLVFLLPAIGNTLGVLPAKSTFYDGCSQFVLPGCLVLFLLGTDLRRLRQLGRSATIAVLAGAFSVFLSGIVVCMLASLWLEGDVWKPIASLIGGWIGGYTSLLVIKESVDCPDEPFAALLLVASVLAYAWIGILSSGAKHQDRFDRWVRSDQDNSLATASDHTNKPPNESVSLVKIAIWIAVSVIVGQGTLAFASADQVAAKLIGNETRLPSIELGNEVGKQEGRCDNGYSCTYLSNISWRSPTQPCGVEINPRRAFDRLFGLQGKESASMKTRAARRQSVLDFVAEDARTLSRSVSGNDNRKLKEFYESVRELELYIDRTSSMPPLRMAPGLRPEATPDSVVHHMRMMYDIMALAFQTDATRVITNMLADGQTSRVYEHLGLTSGHHQLTHSSGLDAEIQRIDQFMAEEFARFVGKLKSIPEGDGTLLDNCMIMFGSGLGDGRKHNHNDLPCVIAGGGGGAVSTGRHLVTPKDTPIANLYLGMIQAAGTKVSEFADSEEPLAGLTQS